ncbi:YvrJ family protein [Desulfitibacter alkalitolerans]|nr:YvrJ family protein [Desulfitibacter alkalitolerans]
MEMIFTQVGNFGFPMVVAIYLLVRVEKKLDELTVAINNLGRVVEKNAS